MAKNEESKTETSTKTTFLGTPVKDAAGEPISVAKTTTQGEEDGEKYVEETVSETKTKSSFLGTPQEDAAGEPIKETTTKTTGK